MDANVLFDVGSEYCHVPYLVRHRVIHKSYSDKSRGNRLIHTTLKNALKVIQVQPSLAEQALPFTEFRCDPSSSCRTSESSSSLLSHPGWSEYSGGASRFAVALRLFRNRSTITARTSRITITALTPIPAFGSALKPLFVVASEVGNEVAVTVVGMLVLGGEAVGEVLGLDEERAAGRSC
jgi:hypothetical protein